MLVRGVSGRALGTVIGRHHGACDAHGLLGSSPLALLPLGLRHLACCFISLVAGRVGRWSVVLIASGTPWGQSGADGEAPQLAGLCSGC